MQNALIALIVVTHCSVDCCVVNGEHAAQVGLDGHIANGSSLIPIPSQLQLLEARMPGNQTELEQVGRQDLM